VTRIDPGVVSLVAELRRNERQAAEELGQWKTHHEERKHLEASSTTVTVAGGHAGQVTWGRMGSRN
jgi:hypothetical protein